MLLKAAFLVIVGLILPLLAIQSDAYLRSGRPFPPRRQIWRNVLATQWVLMAIALLTAWRLGMDWARPPTITWVSVSAGAGVLLAALLLMVLGNSLAPARHLDRLMKLGPRGREDLAWWAGVSLTAGIVEEFVYRGVLTGILLSMTGDLLLAALISAALFAITHMVQGVLGAAIVFLFALGFQWLVHISGHLYTAMAVHVLYDFCAGLYLAFVIRPRRPELGADESDSIAAGPKVPMLDP